MVKLLKNGREDECLIQCLEEINQKQLELASDELLQLIDEEVQKLDGDYSKIIIGGLSQGSIVSLASLFRFQGQRPLGGVIGLSGPLMYVNAHEELSPKTEKII